MHHLIRDNLEDYLTGSKRNIPQEFHAHLKACEECASELRLLEMQSARLRALQYDEEIEPRAGFYARVMERIEAQESSSIWPAFLDPRFARRLTVAAAALIVLLATYLVTTEPGMPQVAPAAAVVMTNPSASDVAAEPDSSIQQQQRDALLVDLASYHE